MEPNVAPSSTVCGVSESEATDSAPTRNDLLNWSEALSGIARTGLGFTESLYEQERFEEVLSVAAEIGVAATGDVDPAPLKEDWLAQVGEGVGGYVTPKIAVGAVVGNDAGELLLIQRSDSGIWLYPTGWADVGYSASEVAEKEVREETGIICEVERVLAIFDGSRRGFHRIPLYSIVFLCRATGGELAGHPLEVTDVGWFSRDALPEPLASADLWVDHAYAAIDGTSSEVLFDQPRR